MPDQEITINDQERELLELVRLQQGLESIEQAAEWLAKRRLRNQARQMNGRGRALYIVHREKP